MTTHNIHSTCRKARCVINTDDRIEYGTPGLEICASVKKSSRDVWPYEEGVWPYDTYCHVAKRGARGVKSSRNDALSEVTVWLRNYGCPGDVPDCDGTAVS